MHMLDEDSGMVDRRVQMTWRLDEEEWRAIRQSGIGASEMAAVVGLDLYASPLQIYLRKRGIEEEREAWLEEMADWSSQFEPLILRAYAKREGVNVLGLDESGVVTLWTPAGEAHTDGLDTLACYVDTIRHPEFPHLFTHLDGLVFETGGMDRPPIRLLEAKNASARVWREHFGDPGSDHIHPSYQVQVQTAAAVFRAAFSAPRELRTDVAVLHDRRLDTFEVAQRPDIGVDLVNRADRFWREYVQAGEAPAATALDSGALKQMFPAHTEGASLVADLGDEANEWARRLAVARATQKVAADERVEFENRIKQRMGEAEEITGVDWRATWRQGSDREVTDWQAAFMELRTVVELHGDHALVAQILDGHTTVKPGSRTFRFTADTED